MVKNCHGFVPKGYRPRPSYYKERDKNWSAGFIEPNTKIVFEIRIIGDFMDNYRTGKYIELYKKIDGLDWEHIDDPPSIKLAMMGLRKELDLPPEEKTEEKFCDISKWT